MADFLKIVVDETKKNIYTISPKFVVKRAKDLMIRGGDFYAVWLEEEGRWSSNEQDALDLIDREIEERYEKERSKNETGHFIVKYMWDSDSGSVDRWHKYCQKQMRDNFHQLDSKLVFANDPMKKEDYASKRLPYPLAKGDISGYDRLMSTLYSEGERRKLEWAIGSIVAGDSTKIQKFVVLYGSAGTGKSTVLNIIQDLFEGYYSVFDAKALGSANNAFALEAFKSNPLVAIQHDGDLSKIEDNTRLNSLVSHELMTVNEKFKSTYENRFQSFLFMGTNKPVKITDSRSGLLRRLIDVSPTGNKLPKKEYDAMIQKVSFELGAIAYYCKEVYLSDPGYYDDYIPLNMMGASNDFFNFMLDSFGVFKSENSTTLKAAWEMYKQYCEEAKVSYPFSMRLFKEELKSYFDEYHERYVDEEGNRYRSYYYGLKTSKFGDEMSDSKEKKEEKQHEGWLTFNCEKSIFDDAYEDAEAQYAKEDATPAKRWSSVKTTLKDIDTSKLHYVKVPINHIVIDFDIPDQNGEKDFDKNLEEASKWPKTYAELSKSGKGIHLHYIYDGDPEKLSSVYGDHVEVKVFKGNSALRRKLTKCNNLPIAVLSSGLPMKGEKKMINFDGFKNEKAIRTTIRKALNLEYFPNTKPSIDFIYKVLDDAYKSGMSYDVTDLRNAVLAFAAGSTNQSEYCIKLVSKMHFKSEEAGKNEEASEDLLIFYDVEVFPNLFLVNWKAEGEGQPVIRMINPSPQEIEELLKFKLIGFNCRRYDNHILYARLIGYTNEQLYDLSQKIIGVKKGENQNYFFREAYNLSYTDVYDFAAKKQSLKKWEIELGISHQELGLPWDEPVPEEKWNMVAEYCDNDVIATEAVFHHLKGDFLAREILADLAGLTVNDTTNTLTTRIIFGKERHPKLVYTDLATGKTDPPEYQRKDIITAFPRYSFEQGEDGKMHNMFRGTDLSFGGYVYGDPGMYYDVALLDIQSLHPNSAIAMNYFGEYTQHFKDILDARILIKHKDFEAAKKMLNGRLAKYLDDPSTAKNLAQALKIAINSVYGLTSASFENAFRDPRNKNNIVALRGALFMKTLQDEVTARGFRVIHVKTDSIKIANASKEIIDFCMEFAKKYGYTFEHEATYDRICLVNNAVYIAKYKSAEWCENAYGYVPGDNADHEDQWTATGTQFQVPYVFKTLFSKEPIEFDDLCETKEVSSGGAIYLDMNENLPDAAAAEAELEKLLKKDPENPRVEELRKQIEDGHCYIFVGRVGRFTPVKTGAGGGLLMCLRRGKYSAVTGSSGYRWMESEMVRINQKEEFIDRDYYRGLVDDAREEISKYGDFDTFVSEEAPIHPWFSAIDEDALPFNVNEDNDELPWYTDVESA